MSSTPDSAPTANPRQDRHLRDALGDVGRAFFDFPSLSEVQRLTIPHIAQGENTLVCAATATGKTEAVIAPLVWRLRQRPAGQLAGPSLLAVAPTRALVADLMVRLENPLARIGWRCGAQTSDFSGADSSPEVLVTTPESFDSMLVRRLYRKEGKVVGHLLANVGAVFVDEAHCFDCTARGDQVIFLLVRLHKLRESALAKGWIPEAAMQVCAASATVHEPQILAERLLGKGAVAVVCPGGRPIDILTRDGHWLRVEQTMSAQAVAELLPSATTSSELAALLWSALESGECRKALVFVPSRRECDRLGLDFRQLLNKRRAIWVDSHHGSLSREHRQRAEKEFHQQRDAVLVATNTLEVGVDIGDVDIVVLVGAPPDTSGLLQRIGRGGRRLGLTRLLPLPRNPVDAAALGSQIVCAAGGHLDSKRRFRRWDVFPQQVISYLRQNQGQGRSHASLVELAAGTWPHSDTISLAEAHLDSWRSDGRLIETRGRIHLGPVWEKFAIQADADSTIHSNIRSTTVGIVVRSQLTGEVIGHVAGPPENTRTLTIAGRQHRVVRRDASIIVAPVTDESADSGEDTPMYGGRRRRVSETFAVHVRRGCGLGDEVAPLVTTPDGLMWFHFGGEIFEAVSRVLFPALMDSSVIAGIATRVRQDFDSNAVQAFNKSALPRFIQKEGLRLIEDEGLGRYADDLPVRGIDALISDSHFLEHFEDWLKTRDILAKKPIRDYPSLELLLKDG